MNSETTRLSIIEYGSPVNLYEKLPKHLKIDRLTANNIFVDAGQRVANYLSIKSNPILLEQNGVRARDFAGMIRLSSSLELEISPKFLGLNDTSWREDFFFLSTLSRHGQLLTEEHISSSSGAVRDLSTLIGRAFASMYQRQRHRPIRAYRRAKQSDFSFNGEIDPMDLAFPNSDGYEQELISFDRNNVWNGNIFSAAKELLSEVGDITAVNLSNLIKELSPQNSRNIFSRSIPARHRAWQPLHDLSIDVLQGLGLTYKQGQAFAPGFVASTWRIWEDLIAIGCRMSFGRNLISSQVGAKLGTRRKIVDTREKTTQLNVFPDYTIEAGENHPRFLIDAKYKGNIEQGSVRIAEADIYEALAFSRASKCNLITLLYPALANTKPSRVGTCSVFEKIEIDNTIILGIQTEVRGISKNGALNDFSFTLKKDLVNAIGIFK